MAWLTGYTYRKLGAVNSTTAGAQTLYQLKLTVGESSGAAGAGVHCENHCIDFPNDIRFTKGDETTKHDYWVDVDSLTGTTPNRKVDVWIEVATIPASGAVDFYIYYTKTSDSGESNGDNTFLFFDDFPGSADKGRWFDNKYASNPIISPNDGSANIDDVGTAWGYFMTNGTNDYRMYYTGIDSGADYDICLATSTDRINWTRTTNGIGGTHKVIDDASAWAGPVWKEGTTYHMIYKKSTAGYKWYHVTSSDGYSWSSATECTGTAGTECSSVMKIGSTYHAWGTCSSPAEVYHFTSTNLTSWTVQNSGNAVLSISGKNVICPDIFYNVDDSKYYVVAAVTPYGAGDPEKYYGTYRMWKADDTDLQTNKVVVGDLLICNADTLTYLDNWEDGGNWDGQHFIWPNIQKQINNSDALYYYYSAEDTMDSTYNFAQGLVYFSTVGAAITKAGEGFTGGLDLNKWTKKANAEVTTNNDIATLKSDDASSSGIYTKVYNHSTDGVIVDYQGKRGTATSGVRAVGSMSDVSAMHKGAGGLALYATTQGVKCWNYAGDADYPTGTIDNIFYDMSTILKPTAIQVTGAGLTATKANTLVSHPISVLIPSSVPWYIKMFRVHKYASPDPTWGSWGAEGEETITYTKTFTADAFLVNCKTKTFTCDAVLEKCYTKAYTINALVSKAYIKAFIVDVHLSESKTKTFIADAILAGGQTKSLSCDAFILHRYTKTCDIDALLSGSIAGITRDSNGDALGNCTVWLFKTSDKSYVDSTTSNVSGEYSFDGILAGVYYFIRSYKDGSPNVFGTTDDNLEAS